MSPVMHVVSTPVATPLERLVQEYLDNCRARGLSPRTVEDNYAPSLERVFLPWCAGNGIRQIADLDRRACDRFSAELLTRVGRYGTTLTKHSVHTYLRPVRQLISWAEREGEEVGAKPQQPKLRKLRKSVLSREELDRMEGAAPTERDKVIIRLFADCGLRLSEVLQLESTHLVRSGRISALDVEGKGGRQRRVPLLPGLARRVERLIESRPEQRDCDRVFLSLRQGPLGFFEPLKVSGVQQVVNDAARRAGIGRTVHPHLLRHSWMTEMLRRGMNPLQLRVIAGASPEVIARHYEHLTEDDAHDAMIRALTNRSHR